MIVGGPNARKDYHYNETEELFYQLEGEITVYIQDKGEKKAMKLSAGDMFLLPAKVPHSPNRSENSIGLVVERKRVGRDIPDGLLWFCDNCNQKLYEVYFELKDIEEDFLKHFEHFYNSIELRTCKNCGTIMETDPRFTAK
jgi:3-hydroxyanthranilate 3,4-dioxygenase